MRSEDETFPDIYIVAQTFFFLRIFPIAETSLSDLLHLPYHTGAIIVLHLPGIETVSFLCTYTNNTT